MVTPSLHPGTQQGVQAHFLRDFARFIPFMASMLQNGAIPRDGAGRGVRRRSRNDSLRHDVTQRASWLTGLAGGAVAQSRKISASGPMLPASNAATTKWMGAVWEKA